MFHIKKHTIYSFVLNKTKINNRNNNNHLLLKILGDFILYSNKKEIYGKKKDITFDNTF